MKVECKCPQCGVEMIQLCQDRDGQPFLGCEFCGAIFRVEEVSVKLTCINNGQPPKAVD